MPGLFEKQTRGDAADTEKKPRAAAQPRKQTDSREIAVKLCERIDGALSGIRGEVVDEETTREEIAQICDTLRPIVRQLEDLEANL